MPGPPSGCCGTPSYQQARYCSGGGLADVFMTTADAASAFSSGPVFTLTTYNICYYFTGTDPGTPGTVYALTDVSSYVATCSACCTLCPSVISVCAVAFSITVNVYASNDCSGVPISTCSSTITSTLPSGVACALHRNDGFFPTADCMNAYGWNTNTLKWTGSTAPICKWSYSFDFNGFGIVGPFYKDGLDGSPANSPLGTYAGGTYCIGVPGGGSVKVTVGQITMS